jgi:hypothetical protein
LQPLATSSRKAVSEDRAVQCLPRSGKLWHGTASVPSESFVLWGLCLQLRSTPALRASVRFGTANSRSSRKLEAFAATLGVRVLVHACEWSERLRWMKE